VSSSYNSPALALRKTHVSDPHVGLAISEQFSLVSVATPAPVREYLTRTQGSSP
jgi:hypothetical protein